MIYLFEIQRETKLITYLEVNTTVPGDNESVGKSLELLPEEKKHMTNALHKLQKKYIENKPNMTKQLMQQIQQNGPPDVQ